METLYLDYNATTPLDPRVIGVISKALSENWANPSSGYKEGREAKEVIETARRRVAEVVGSEQPGEEITFTSGGTEANYWVIHCALKAYENWKKVSGSEKPHVIMSNVEHPAMDLPLRNQQEVGVIDLSVVDVEKKFGSVSVTSILAKLRPNTCLITLMLANNESGVLQPIGEVGQALQKINQDRIKQNLFPVLFHTDAAQAIGKITVDVKALNVDYLTIVGHKFYGPRIGALFHSAGTPVSPLFLGGGQEGRRRPGTENTPMCAGLGEAARLTTQGLARDSGHLRAMRDRLARGLKASLGDDFATNFSHVPDHLLLPNTLSASFAGVRGHALLAACARPVAASTQAACHTANTRRTSCANGRRERTDESDAKDEEDESPGQASRKRAKLEEVSGDAEEDEGSPILRRSGVSADAARGSVRLSVGRDTTEEEVDLAIEVLAEAYMKLTQKL